jgi:hypothetical protein
MVTPTNGNANPAEHAWNASSSKCTVHLVIKKIAISIIFTANLAALGTAMAYIVMYCPIPAQVATVAPLVTGVLGALIYLKVPLLGINNNNYYDYTEPSIFLGRVITMILFAPLIVAIKNIDWINYRDPFVANRVSNELSDWKWDQVADKYGKKIGNLKRYGFLGQKDAETMRVMYKNYQPVKKVKDFLGSEQLSLDSDLKMKIATVESDWVNLKNQINLPRPQYQLPDFTKKFTSFKLFFRPLSVSTPN